MFFRKNLGFNSLILFKEKISIRAYSYKPRLENFLSFLNSLKINSHFILEKSCQKYGVIIHFASDTSKKNGEIIHFASDTPSGSEK